MLFSLISLYGIEYTGNVGNQFEGLESDTVPALISLMEIIASTRQASLKALEFHQRASDDDRAKALEALDKIQAGLSSYKTAMLDQGPAKQQNLDVKVDNFIKIIKNYLSVNNLSMDDTERQIHETRRELIHALYPLIETEKKELREASDNTYLLISNASVFLSSSILIVILISLFAGYLVGRSITIPLARLNEAAHFVAKGDLERELGIQTTDEIGQLATSFGNMRKELQVHRDELEGLVKKRTMDLEISNQELESYSYSIAHDLRTPLRSIASFSQIIMQDSGDKLQEEDRDHLNRIIKSSSHMSELIHDILELSRVSRTHMHISEVNLSDLCLEISKELEESSTSRKVEWLIQPYIKVNGDQRLLYLVLSNLLGNAWKFTQKNSHTLIEFGLKEDGQEKIIFVRDNGVGFDMEYLDQLFGLFNRLHRADEYEGTGVGLATVKRILERHDGWIKAEGQYGKGASFYFSIP